MTPPCQDILLYFRKSFVPIDRWQVWDRLLGVIRPTRRGRSATQSYSLTNRIERDLDIKLQMQEVKCPLTKISCLWQGRSHSLSALTRGTS